jgi:ABC-2 type transport system ATP-binding protein
VEAAVKINKLSVTLGGHFMALKNVSLELPHGKTIGFIGPSGAGKTTLIRCIVGRQKLSKGSVTVFGQAAGSPTLRSQIGYMTQEVSVYSDLTVAQNLSYFAVMGGMLKRQIAKTVHETLGVVGLKDKAGVVVNQLSGGQKQRVSLAVTLLNAPELLVLDEPTVGLDPVLREQLWELFDKLATQGKTLIISSHSMDEAERCDDLVLIRDGEVIAHNTPADFCWEVGASSVEQGFLKAVEAKS